MDAKRNLLNTVLEAIGIHVFKDRSYEGIILVQVLQQDAIQVEFEQHS